MTRALDKPSHDNHAALANRVLSKLEEAAGGRQALLEALVHAAETPDQERLLGMLADPRWDATRLGKVCAAANFSVGEFLSFLKRGKHARALVEAMDRVNELLPDVAEDFMQRAVPHLAPCVDCLGSGVQVFEQPDPDHPSKVVEVEKRCLVCRGAGKVPVQPDLARQKVALEVGGLLKREAPGTTVVVNQQQGLMAGFGFDARRDFRGRTDEILYGKVEGGAEGGAGGGQGQGEGGGLGVVDAEPADEVAGDER